MGLCIGAVLSLQLSRARRIGRRRRSTSVAQSTPLYLTSTPVGRSSSNFDEQPSKTPEGREENEGRRGNLVRPTMGIHGFPLVAHNLSGYGRGIIECSDLCPLEYLNCELVYLRNQ